MWVIVSPRANRPPIAQPAATLAPTSSVPTRMATLISVEALVQLIGFVGAASAKACLLVGAFGARPVDQDRVARKCRGPKALPAGPSACKMAKIDFKPMSLLVDRPHRAEAARSAHDHAPHGGVGALTLGALGVVFGSVGTSPLYAMDQIFRAGGSRTPDDALGAASLAIWSLTLVVSVQYPLLVLRAQNDGEGGVFALYGLLHDR